MIAVQTAVGDIGSKATTDISKSFNDLLNCGRFQYGLRDDGLYLLNTGELDTGVDFQRSITIPDSDFGLRPRRLRYVFLNVETFGNTSLVVSVKPHGGSWRDSTFSITGSGEKNLRILLNRVSGVASSHSIKLASSKRFNVNSVAVVSLDRATGN